MDPRFVVKFSDAKKVSLKYVDEVDVATHTQHHGALKLLPLAHFLPPQTAT
jgi:hypothetical protein